MEKLIKDIIELDKTYRMQVNQLREEKEKINDIVREEKKRMQKNFQTEANKKKIEIKDQIVTDLDTRKKTAIAEYDSTLKALEKSFQANSDNWVEKIYNYCLEEE